MPKAAFAPPPPHTQYFLFFTRRTNRSKFSIFRELTLLDQEHNMQCFQQHTLLPNIPGICSIKSNDIILFSLLLLLLSLSIITITIIIIIIIITITIIIINIIIIIIIIISFIFISRRDQGVSNLCLLSMPSTRHPSGYTRI